VPVSYFFEEMSAASSAGPRKAGRRAAIQTSVNTKRETLELVRAYYKIRSDGVRKQIRNMVLALT
jgi:hypothetical protein